MRNSPINDMNLYEAAVLLRMSPRLLRWFTSHAPKHNESKKLRFHKDKAGEMYFEKDDLLEFDRYLSNPWPCGDSGRPTIPDGIKLEIQEESCFRCLICLHTSGEFAHIDPVHNSHNNHPHNLVYLCPNCHDQYDNKKQYKEAQIRAIKKDVIETRLSIWRSTGSLLSLLLTLIRKLEIINNKVGTFKIYEMLNDDIMKAISGKSESGSFSSDNPQISKRIQTAYESDDIVVNLVNERTSIIETSQLKDCPLCEGSGVHNAWECPICRGEGTVHEEGFEDIDLSPFSPEKCPLCLGSGVHNRWECPVCRGVGTVDAMDLEEIDISAFSQEECPLCTGSGTHNRWECPVCRGVGTVDAMDLEEIDLSLFSQEECPLCKGSGTHNRWECPVCRGVRTVDAVDLDDIDISAYSQEECPLCTGSGTHNRWECPICRGVGTIDAQDSDDIDLALFSQENCPVCSGTGVHDGRECKCCRGVRRS